MPHIFKTKKLDIEVDHNQVTIEHQTVKRPSGIAPSEWYRFWEDVKQTVTTNGLVDAFRG